MQQTNTSHGETQNIWKSSGASGSGRYRSSIGYCSTIPLHGVLFNRPSTGYCSSCPPPATIQPALHRVLFIHHPPATVHGASTWSCSSTLHRPPRLGSCSSSGNSLYYHGVLFIQPPPGTVHPTPNNSHCSSTGKFDRLHLAKESLGFS